MIISFFFLEYAWLMNFGSIYNIFLHAQISLNDWNILVNNLKGCRMGRSDKVSLWYVALLINTRFRFFILE